MRKQFSRRTTLTLLASGLAGCTISMPIKTPQGAAAIAKRLPLSVGYFLSAQLTGYEDCFTVKGEYQLVFPIGKASRSTLEGMFEALLASANPIASQSGSKGPVGNADAAIEPRPMNSSIKGLDLLGRAATWYVDLDCLFLLSDPTGREITQWSMPGSGNSGTGIDLTGLAGNDSAGAALTNALNVVENRFLAGFTGIPEIHAWLKSKEIDAP